jgi:actin related protein 2/3 complex subunit 4
MVESYKPYLTIIRDTLEQALCLRNIPSQLYEKINRPQVEVKESLELVNKPVIISRNEGEKVEIESSANSVRVNVAIKKHAEIEKLIVGIYSNYLMNRANQLNILRKVAKPGYDISFLITNFTLENYKKEDIIDFIIEFILREGSEYIIQLTQGLTASDINTDSHLIILEITVTGNLCKFINKHNRKIIHAKIVRILKYIEYGGFSCAAHSRDYHKSHTMILTSGVSSTPCFSFTIRCTSFISVHISCAVA